MARLFIAVRPPPPVLDALAQLPRADDAGVRWVPPSQWHITVRFLGDASIEDAIGAVDALPVGGPRPVAHLGPSVSRLGRNVVCVPCAGLDALTALVVDVTSAIGDPPDPRPFAGHLTLARLRQRAACGLAGVLFDASFEVHDIEVVRSTLSSSGAAHEIVHTKHL